MRAKIFRIVLLLMIATQVVTTSTSEKKEPYQPKHPPRSRYNSRGSGDKPKRRYPKPANPSRPERRHQKPENPLGAGMHYCLNSHFNMGMGCPDPETCKENPESPNYRYRK